jgi:hypothetical protein
MATSTVRSGGMGGTSTLELHAVHVQTVMEPVGNDAPMGARGWIGLVIASNRLAGALGQAAASATNTAGVFRGTVVSGPVTSGLSVERNSSCVGPGWGGAQ